MPAPVVPALSTRYQAESKRATGDAGASGARPCSAMAMPCWRPRPATTRRRVPDGASLAIVSAAPSRFVAPCTVTSVGGVKWLMSKRLCAHAKSVQAPPSTAPLGCRRQAASSRPTWRKRRRTKRTCTGKNLTQVCKPGAPAAARTAFADLTIVRAHCQHCARTRDFFVRPGADSGPLGRSATRPSTPGTEVTAVVARIR